MVLADVGAGRVHGGARHARARPKRRQAEVNTGRRRSCADAACTPSSRCRAVAALARTPARAGSWRSTPHRASTPSRSARTTPPPRPRPRARSSCATVTAPDSACGTATSMVRSGAFCCAARCVTQLLTLGQAPGPWGRPHARLNPPEKNSARRSTRPPDVRHRLARHGPVVQTALPRPQGEPIRRRRTCTCPVPGACTRAPERRRR